MNWYWSLVAPSNTIRVCSHHREIDHDQLAIVTIIIPVICVIFIKTTYFNKWAVCEGAEGRSLSLSPWSFWSSLSLKYHRFRDWAVRKGAEGGAGGKGEGEPTVGRWKLWQLRVNYGHDHHNHHSSWCIYINVIMVTRILIVTDVHRCQIQQLGVIWSWS